MKEFSKYTVNVETSIKGALVCLEGLSSDELTLFVVDKGLLVGTVTDGDIRRALIRGITLDSSIDHVMNKQFRFIRYMENNVGKVREIRNLGIRLLPCIDGEGRLVEVYNIHKTKALLPIDAVLMAGGRGQRLMPLTEKTPKPLLMVGDKAIIDHNVDRLLMYGVQDIHVTTNYLADQLESHFVEARDGVQIQCFREKRFMGTIACVKQISSIKSDVVLVMNSDLFTNIDFEDFYWDFIARDADMSVAAIPYSINIPYGIFDLNGSEIRGIREKPTYNYYANAGIYLVRRELLNLIPEDVFYDATDFIDLLISHSKSVVRYPLVGYWIDIGKHEDYLKAQDFIKHIKS